MRDKFRADMGEPAKAAEERMIQGGFSRPARFTSAVVLMTSMVATSVGQTKAHGSQKTTETPAKRKVDASAIWTPKPDFLKNAQAACVQNPGGRFPSCLIREMAKAGASSEAVEFSRRLYEQNGGEFGFVWSFQKVGPVDMAKVEYPLRDMDYKYAAGSRREALLLVNGDPPIVDVDDLTKLDRRGMEQDEGYQLLKKNYPNIELWGGARGGTMFEPAEKRPDGGVSFEIIYLLNPGRPAGRWVSGAHFKWDFDALGKFVGTRFTGGVGPLPD